MRVEYLIECLDLAETLSFTTTAKHFYLTQSVLSKHIASLEQEIGIQLFNRTRNGVTLAKQSEQFFKDAQSVVNAYNLLLEHVDDALSGRIATINLGYLPGTHGKSMPRIRKEFERACPNIALQIFAFEPIPLLNGLDNGSLDMIISINAHTPFEGSKSSEKVHLFDDPIVAVMDKRHPLAKQDVLKAKDMIGYTVCLPAETYLPYHNRLLKSYIETGSDQIIVDEALHDLNSLPVLLTSSNSIALAFKSLEKAYGSALKFIPLADFRYQASHAIVWFSDNKTPGLQALAEIITQTIPNTL